MQLSRNGRAKSIKVNCLYFEQNAARPDSDGNSQIAEKQRHMKKVVMLPLICHIFKLQEFTGR